MQNNTIYNIILPFVKSLNFKKEASADLVFTPLQRGLSKAHNFKFKVNENEYVVRIFASNEEKNNLHQIELAQKAGEIKVGPKVHFIDSNLQAIIMDFIPNGTVIPLDFQEKSKLKIMAQFLAKLHTANSHFPIARSPFERFRSFIHRGIKNEIIFPVRFAEVILLMNQIESIFKKHKIHDVPCHLDLHPLNILNFKNTFLAVDWTNGGMNNPYFDLATFAIFHDLNADQINIFLTSYFKQSPTRLQTNLFIIAQPVRLFVISAAFLSVEKPEITSENVPNLKEFIELQLNGKSNLSLPEIGFIMYQAGLEITDSIEFRTAFQNLL